MTIPSIREFEAKGWFLSEQGLDRIHSHNKNLTSLKDYIHCAKDMDLCELTTKLDVQRDQLTGPLVLQVVDIKRKKVVAAAIGGLTITFTDGHNQYTAAEILGKLECIRPHTPPGTKYTVVKPIEIKDGILVLGPGLLREEGGHVESLYVPWKKSRKPASKASKKKKSPVITEESQAVDKDTKDKEDIKKDKSSKKAEQQQLEEQTPLPSRIPTPALSETSQKKKKKKNRKPRSKKSKATTPLTADSTIEEPPIEQQQPDTTKQQQDVPEEIKTVTEDPISPPSDISPVSINTRAAPPLPLPPMGYVAPPPEYYYPPVYMDHTMMVPVMYPPYMPPPPYMQPVYYVSHNNDQQQHHYPPYYAYPQQQQYQAYPYNHNTYHHHQ